MAQIRRGWWVGLGAVVVVVAIAILVAAHFLNADNYRGQIEASLTQALGRQVQVGHLDFSLLSGSLVAKDASIADDPRFSTQPFLTAKDIRLGIDTGAYVFHKQIHITGLTIDEPRITLLRGENGTWNYSTLGKPKPNTPDPQAASTGSSALPPNLTVARMSINNGTVAIGSSPHDGSPHVWSDVNVTAQNFSLAAAFPFTASGKLPDEGSVDINGHAGPVDQSDAALTPLTAKISLHHANLLAAGLVEPQQGVSGIADLDATVNSSGGQAHLDGKLHVTQLKLAKNGVPSAQPVDAQFATVQDLRALTGRIANATVQVGHAAMTLAGTYKTTGAVTALQMQAAGQNMPVDDLIGFLPALGVQFPAGSHLRGGTLTTTLDISGPVDAPVISGPVRLSNVQLAGFDLGQKLGSIQALMGAKTGGDTTIQSLTTQLHYGPEGTRTDNLAVVVSGLGSASGSGIIKQGGGLDYHLVIKLASTGVGGLATQGLSMLQSALGPAGSSNPAKNGIPVTVSGTTSNPVFTPSMGKVLGGVAPKNPPAKSLSNALGGLLGH